MTDQPDLPISSPPAASSAPGILFRDASVTLPGGLLFSSLRAEIPGGGCTCLLGPSGVGKSMLLRLALGLASGIGHTDVTVSGTVSTTNGGPVAGQAAFMAQQDLLLPWLSVIDNVMLGHRLRGAAGDIRALRDKALDLLHMVGLGGRDTDRPAALSGGMRQRVALARTLMEDRSIVLMDEPFSALDAITRVRLQDLAARLLAGRTVLLVTHDPLEALRLGHRIHVMSGRPASLDEPLDPPGSPPRPVDDPAVLERQGTLLTRLTEAAR